MTRAAVVLPLAGRTLRTDWNIPKLNMRNPMVSSR
jgi:hypothetical protein